MEIKHIVLGKANPNRMNGVNKVVNSLATYQTQLGHEVTVLGIANDLDRNFPNRNYETELFQTQKFKFNANAQLEHVIRNSNPDTIFHLHGGFIPEFRSVSKAIIKVGFEYFFTPHGAYNTVAMEKSKWTKKIYFNLIEKSIVENAKAIHCIGQSEVDALENLNTTAKSVLVPNGQNVEELQYRHKSLKKRKNTVFGFCGRIDIHTKGLDHLLNGFAQHTRDTDGSSELWIIGGDGESEALKTLAQNLDIDNKITFWGKQFGEEKLNIMANMDAFFHPSRNEGLPGAVLEAAGLGVPCVVSRESNVSEYINKHQAGISLNENNPNEVAKAMATIAEATAKNELTPLKENAKKMIEQEFNWKGISNQLVKAYES